MARVKLARFQAGVAQHLAEMADFRVNIEDGYLVESKEHLEAMLVAAESIIAHNQASLDGSVLTLEAPWSKYRALYRKMSKAVGQAVPDWWQERRKKNPEPGSKMPEDNPKKVLTGQEVQDAIEAGTLKPMDVDTYRWGASMGSKGTQIFRKRWARIRPGLYGRILGEYEVLVEECEPYESCPPGDRGWFSAWTPIASGRSLDHDGRSDFPVPTYKEAKADVERWLTDKKVDDPWVQNPKAKPPLEHFPIRRVCSKGRGTKADCRRAPVLCGRCLQRVCGHFSGSSNRVDLETGETIGYLDTRPYAITLGSCMSCRMKPGGWTQEEAIAAVRERLGGAPEENPPRAANPGSNTDLMQRLKF